MRMPGRCFDAGRAFGRLDDIGDHVAETRFERGRDPLAEMAAAVIRKYRAGCGRLGS
jgi:hypothetical protein